MRIFVFSDSHHIINGMIDICRSEKPDCVFHLGDMVKDAEELQEQYFGAVCYVRGNNDWGTDAEDEIIYPAPGNCRILLCHGHKFGVRGSTDSLYAAAVSRKCSIVLFGHTHARHYEERSGIIIANPGAVGFSDSFIELKIDQTGISLDFRSVC